MQLPACSSKEAYYTQGWQVVAAVAGNPVHTHMCVSPHTTPSCGFVAVQAAALGRHLARQFPDLLSASSSQRPLVHCSTAVRAAKTAAIALAQFPPGPGNQGPASSACTGQQQLPAVVASSSELLELSQGSWVSLAGCVSVCWCVPGWVYCSAGWYTAVCCPCAAA